MGMLKSNPVRITALISLAAYLWLRATARAHGGLGNVFVFSAAGIVSAIALTWVCWSFASVAFTRRTAAISAIVGLVICTPLIYMMLTGNTDKVASQLVLAVTAAGAAAMAGAIWSVAHAVRGSLTEWKNDRSDTADFSIKEAHR
jgi:hypothetical protein